MTQVLFGNPDLHREFYKFIYQIFKYFVQINSIETLGMFFALIAYFSFSLLDAVQNCCYLPFNFSNIVYKILFCIDFIFN